MDAGSLLKSVAGEVKPKKTAGCHWIGPFKHAEYQHVSRHFGLEKAAPKDLKALLLKMGDGEISIYGAVNFTPVANDTLAELLEAKKLLDSETVSS